MDGYLGEIRMFAGNYAPVDWALCDGRLLSISENEALFALLGTTYGGDGRINFGVPDLRGKAPMSVGSGVIPGSGQPLTPRALGDSVGAETVALTQGNLPSHNHRMAAGATGATNTPSNKLPGLTVNNQYSQTTSAAATMHQAMVSGSGGGNQAHNNMMPTTCINFIIALTGNFPTAA